MAGLAWAEQYVPTGFAALIIAVTPIWFLVLETFVFRGDRMSRRGLDRAGDGHCRHRHSGLAEDRASRSSRHDAVGRLDQPAVLVDELGGRLGVLAQVADEGRSARRYRLGDDLRRPRAFVLVACRPDNTIASSSTIAA